MSADKLTQARDHLSAAFELLDDVVLDEPERGAALTLKREIADNVRRLGNLIVFATMAER